ncbi:MAG: ATP-binding protein [Rhodospirillales bacterium]
MNARFGIGRRWQWALAWLDPGVPEGEPSSQTLRGMVASALTMVLALLAIAVPFLSTARLIATILSLAELIIGISAILLVRLGRARLATWIFLTGSWCVITAVTFLSGGLRGVGPVAYLGMTVIAGCFLGQRVALAVAGFSMAVTLAFAVLEKRGDPLPHYLLSNPFASWMLLWFSVAITVVPMNQMLRRLNKSLRFSRRRIEDLRRTQEALREGEEKYRELFEMVSDALFLIDNQDGRLLEVNPSAAAMYGYPREELLGMKNTDFSAEPDSTRAATLAGRTFVPVRWHRKKDGTVFPVEITARHFNRQGRPVHIAAIRDITDRLRAEEEHSRIEEQLRQSQRLESVGRLAGGVAHDFNNLLTVINGYADMLRYDLDEDDPLRAGLDEIKRAGERAASLTQQLLAFSRKQMIEPKPIDLNAVVAESEKMLRRLVGEDIEFVTTLSASPGAVMADPGQIHQILMNLAVNARDAMPNGGVLHVDTASVDLSEEEAAGCQDAAPGAYVRLSVRDSGVGMDNETLQRIFEPFFTTKKQGEGTGLGLSVVYGIVRQSGGWIHVSSELGKGTVFDIYLPRLDAAVLETAAPKNSAENLRGSECVLVVEDQEEVRKLAVEVLKSYGYSVLEAEQGEDALKVAARHQGSIHLILSDVIMPGMTGHELAARIAPFRPDAKVLYMSGYSRDVIGRGGVLDSKTPCVPKPFAPEQLARKVREMLEA